MKNWELKKLGEVCKFEGGSQPPKTEFTFEKNDNLIRLIQIRDYKSDNHIVYIPKDKAKRFCNENDIMIGRYGPPVFQILRGLSGAYNVALMKAIPNEKVLSKDFVYLFLKYSKIQDYIIHLSQRAAGQTGVNKEAIEDYPILLPPLPEQQRIVSILDEAFDAISKARSNAEQNLKNAKELFESYLQSVFATEEVGWEEKSLGEIGTVEYGYTDNSTADGDYRYIRITDIDKNGELILDDKKYISHSKEAKNFILTHNDLLMARTGATFAKVLLYNDYEPSVFASYLIRIKFTEKIENKLYWYFTKTKSYWQQANGLSSGAAQPHFNGAAVKQVLFRYPKSVAEQKILIGKFEEFSTETKRLEDIYQQKIADLDELKKSVLQKAFNGELKTIRELVV